MKKQGRLFAVMLICLFAVSALTQAAFANSAEPPSIVILAVNPPEDMSVALVSNENHPEAVVRKAAWESYYVFYSREIQEDSQYTFRITANGGSFDCTIDAPLRRYNNVFTLDIPKKRLTPGTYPLRTALLVSIRLTLTLLLEGLVFFLFGFRQKRSWLAFLAVNLVTQGGLNIWLNNGGSLMPSYPLLGLIIGEFLVFLVEMLAFPAYIREHKKIRVLPAHLPRTSRALLPVDT